MTSPLEQKILHAYEQMLKRFHAQVEKAETKTLPALEEQWRQVEEKAVELGEVTREEALKVSQYLKRDLVDLSTYLQETSDEFSDWLSFESTLLEDKVGQMLSDVADKTKLQWEQLKLNHTDLEFYQSGEMVSGGTLACTDCDQTLHFKKAGHIPPCPRCHKTKFVRQHAK